MKNSQFSSSNEWSTLNSTGNAPAAREGHSATLIGTKMYIYGGKNLLGFLGDMYVFDFESVRAHVVHSSLILLCRDHGAKY